MSSTESTTKTHDIQRQPGVYSQMYKQIYSIVENELSVKLKQTDIHEFFQSKFFRTLIISIHSVIFIL